MGMVIIRCPATRRAIPARIQTDRATFRSMPVFFSQVVCPLCRAAHHWFAKDEWQVVVIQEESQPLVVGSLETSY
jgi:hypothetical protein